MTTDQKNKASHLSETLNLLHSWRTIHRARLTGSQNELDAAITDHAALFTDTAGAARRAREVIASLPPHASMALVQTLTAQIKRAKKQITRLHHTAKAA